MQEPHLYSKKLRISEKLFIIMNLQYHLKESEKMSNETIVLMQESGATHNSEYPAPFRSAPIGFR